MKIIKGLSLALLLTACSSLPVAPSGPAAMLTFQNGQSTTIRLTGTDPALQSAFQQWVGQGVYTQAPVYRQLPGIFILTGKPRLSGKGYIPGTAAAQPKSSEAKTGDIGLIRHADGSVGPEIILIYGHAIASCCEAPANVRIGTITAGQSQLKSVQRGDNLQAIAIHP